MNLRKLVLAVGATVGLAVTGLGASNPISEAKAIALTAKTTVQSKAITLYKTTDKETKKVSYVCYYKMTLQKGKPYTVWVDGTDMAAGKVRLAAAYGKESWDWDIDAPIARFDDIDCGVETRWHVSGKEWESKFDNDWEKQPYVPETGGDWGDDWGDDPVTPNTWTYYILVEGTKAGVMSAKLNYVMAKKIPKGVAANPLVIKPTNDLQRLTLTDGFMGDYYYIQVALKKGLCYRFSTDNGVAGNDLSIDEAFGFTGGQLGPYPAWKKSHNQAISFLPSANQTVTFRLQSSKGYKATGKIKFFVEKSLAIAKHKSSKLTIGKGIYFYPGYRNVPDSGYFDLIPDEKLFKLSTVKGKNYVIETTGASALAPIVATLYDASGNILETNRSKGSDSPDVRVHFTAAKAGTYYIGVCEDQPIFEEKTPKYKKACITAYQVGTITKSTKVSPLPTDKLVKPATVDTKGGATINFGKNCWYATANFAAMAGTSYALSVNFTSASNTETNKLSAEIYKTKVSSANLVKKSTFTPGTTLTFKATVSGTYYVRIRPAAGEALDYKPVRIHAIGYLADGTKCGALKVTLTGADGKWMIGSDKAQYASGTSVIVPIGTKTLNFTAVKGYTTPASVKAKALRNQVVEVGDIYYTDKWDPKDDATKYPTTWKVTGSTTKVTGHTLWKPDKYDCFSFTSAGYHYTFKLTDFGEGDHVITVKGPDGTVYVAKKTYMTRVLLPKASKPYTIIVGHKTTTNVGGAYTLTGRYENLGVVKFAKAEYTAKDSATSVSLYATRTGTKGDCRVKYSIVAGTAKAGVNYIASTGYVSWKDGDKASKKISIRLVPKAIPVKSADLKFTVKLQDASTAKVNDGLTKLLEAAFPSFKTYASTTVKIANSATYKTAAAAYASVYTDKKYKPSNPETDAYLRTGTFYGLVAETGTALTNGAPEFGSVTLTVVGGKTVNADTLSAKVLIAGRTYAFKTAAGEKAWDGKTEQGYRVKTLRKVVACEDGEYTNELTVAVSDGKAATGWNKSVCTASLKLRIPDVAGNGGQTDIAYTGSLYRRNGKVQAYLDTAFKFDGYYTVSLVPNEIVGTDYGAADRGVPSGNGYLTIAVDNKGGAQIAGLLPDQTPIAVSATACTLKYDSASATKYAMIIPVYQANSNSCFAAELRLFMQADAKHLDGKGYKTVVDSKGLTYWNCDDGSVTEDGVQGWRMTCVPVGGWYDKLANLQGYYNSQAKSFEAGSPNAFPSELLGEGYEYVAYPHGVSVDLTGDKFSTPLRSLVVDGDNPNLHDFDASVNPCNVKVTFNRATGVSSGTSSAWISNGTAEKQLGGFTHFGVLTIDRDTRSGITGGLDAEVLISGGLVKPISVDGRTWMFSIPFEVYAD